MKISLFSDVHIEFDKPPMIDNPGADVLILSGDIFPIHTIFEHPDHPLVDVFRAFIKHCCENWNSVVYVMGNHEFYHGDIHDDVDALKDNLAEYENLFILDDEWVIIDGVKFIGSTLWTDANNENPLTLSVLGRYMNDYRLIHNDGINIFKPFEAVERHKNSLKFIQDEVDDNHGHPRVVVTHHAPSYQSINIKYKDDYDMNGGYASDLSETILDRPNILLWTHGHVHNSFDYKIGETRIVANPKGYKNENPQFDPNMIIEI